MRGRIVEIHKMDSFYGTRDEYIGKVGEISSVYEGFNPGYESFDFTPDDYVPLCDGDDGTINFYAARFEPVE